MSCVLLHECCMVHDYQATAFCTHPALPAPRLVASTQPPSPSPYWQKGTAFILICPSPSVSASVIIWSTSSSVSFSPRLVITCRSCNGGQHDQRGMSAQQRRARSLPLAKSKRKRGSKRSSSTLAIVILTAYQTVHGCRQLNTTTCLLPLPPIDTTHASTMPPHLCGRDVPVGVLVKNTESLAKLLLVVAILQCTKCH
jgi:hypothetical protein